MTCRIRYRAEKTYVNVRRGRLNITIRWSKRSFFSQSNVVKNSFWHSPTQRDTVQDDQDPIHTAFHWLLTLVTGRIGEENIEIFKLSVRENPTTNSRSFERVTNGERQAKKGGGIRAMARFGARRNRVFPLADELISILVCSHLAKNVCANSSKTRSLHII